MYFLRSFFNEFTISKQDTYEVMTGFPLYNFESNISGTHNFVGNKQYSSNSRTYTTIDF